MCLFLLSVILVLGQTHICLLQGTFGVDCNNICTCRNGGTCSHTDGVCHCPPGVKGDNCEDGCPPGYYGHDCDKPCPQPCPSGFCNRIFGYCECLPGLFGPSCNLPCPPFSWGPNCNGQCDCNTDNSAKCDAKVGVPCQLFFH